MSVLLPGNQSWLAAGWVISAFFRDALETGAGDAGLRACIARCIEVESRTLDLEDRPPAEIREFDAMVAAVIAYNDRLQGSNFGQPEFYPGYAAQLRKLKQAVEDSLTGLARK